MKTRSGRLAGFSLVEVVLAIGIVGFALLSVFSLFSVSIQTNAATMEQVEALSAVKALPAFLQAVKDGSTPPNQGFAPVYAWVSNTNNPIPAASSSVKASAPLLYAFNNPTTTGAAAPEATGQPGQSVVMAVPVPVDPSVQANVGQAATARQGRLYGRLPVSFSEFPIGSTVFPTAATLTQYSPGPVACVQLPGGGARLAGQGVCRAAGGRGAAGWFLPILTYDLTLPR